MVLQPCFFVDILLVMRTKSIKKLTIMTHYKASYFHTSKVFFWFTF